MAALGCLAPFLLAIIGAVVGHLGWGVSGLPWGLGIGLLIGSGLGWLFWMVMKRASDDG